jgi:membrane fusion protein (multidrug efflux system)
MSESLKLRGGQTGQSARSANVPVTSSNGAEALPRLPALNGRNPPRKPAAVRWLILISEGIICVSIIARIGYYLLGEETPTTDKAVVVGNTYLVSSRIEGTIAGILVSNRQYVKAGDLLAEIDKRDLRTKLAAAHTDLLQAQTVLPEIETQLSKAQAEIERAESRIVLREKEFAEATSDFQYISKIRNKKNVSPLLFSRAKKEFESALS